MKLRREHRGAPQGAGGGGGKGGGAPTEAPNTLRARMKVRMLFAISEGPILGFSNLGQQIYLNDTQLVGPDGEANFEGVSYEARNGDAVQSHIPGFSTAEDTFSVGVKVEESASPPVRTVDLANRDRLRVIVQVNSLYKVDDKGNVNPNTVEYAIEWRVAGSGAGWTLLHQGNITGKTVSAYPRSFVAPVPSAGSIELRVRRITPDPPDSKDVNDLFWSSYATILDQKLTYPGTALVGIAFDATEQGGSVPTVTFEPDGGLICEVPTNYDPITRVYTGIWDGTFKKAWTDNPAWIFWTVATNPDWGGGTALSSGLVSPAAAYALASGLVDRWALYAISQYCDGMVPDGRGGTEPRYRFHAYINRADEAYRVLQAIATGFRGMLYWGRGQIVPIIDRPRDAVKLVTRSNIIGDFQYEGAALPSRHSVVKVRWRDPALNYRENVAVVEDPEMMREVGIRSVDYDAIGCISLSQALRMGRWVLYTEKYETGLLSYRASVDHVNVSPGDVIAVQDEKKAGIAFSGRLARSPLSTTSVQLDRPITIVSGKSYWLRVAYADGTLSAALPITTAPATTDLLTLSTALAQDVVPEAVWVVIASDLVPETYQVMAIEELQDNTFQVSALRHYAAKHDVVELGLKMEEPPTNVFGPVLGQLPPPTNLVVGEYLTGVGETPLVRVVLSWTPPTDPRVVKYEAQAMQGPTVVQMHFTAESTVTFHDLQPGIYTLRVRAIGGQGIISAWATMADVDVDGRADPPATISALSIQSGIRTISLSWTRPVGQYLRHMEVQAAGLGFNNASFEPLESLPAAPSDGAFSTLALIDGTRFVHSGLATSHVWYYRVRAVDVFGQTSAWVGPIGARTSYLIAADIQDGILNTAKFAAGIEPVGLVPSGALPTTKSVEVIFHGPTNQLYRWDSVTSAYVRVVRALDLDGLIAGSQISSIDTDQLIGQVQEAQIADNAVVAAKIAAGAITTGKLAVAPPSGNLIWNSCLPYGREGWTVGGTVAPTGWGAVGNGLDLADNTWRLVGRGTGGMWRAGVIAAGDYMDMYWVGTEGVSFSAQTRDGEWWEWQAHVQAHRCTVQMIISWYDSAGTYISETLVDSVSQNGLAAANALPAYGLRWGKAQAPANSRRMLAFFRVVGLTGLGSATGTDPYLFFTQALLARSHANQTEPSPWGPGGVTEINGGMLRARSIAADRIVASAITATEIATNAITADKLAANSVIAGKIAAGAISATEIAAGAIVASKLAATDVITLTAQIANGIITSAKIGDAQITNAKIGNLEVGTIKIADGAVSSSVSASFSGSATLGSETTHVTIVIGDSFGGSFLLFADMDVFLSESIVSGESPYTVYGSYILRIRRNGTLIFEQAVSRRYRTVIRLDAPGAGSHTYTLTTQLLEVSGTVYYALLAAMQTKK